MRPSITATTPGAVRDEVVKYLERLADRHWQQSQRTMSTNRRQQAAAVCSAFKEAASDWREMVIVTEEG